MEEVHCNFIQVYVQVSNSFFSVRQARYRIYQKHGNHKSYAAPSLLYIVTKIYNPSTENKSRGVDLAAGAQAATAEKVPLRAHEVGITSDVGLGVEPWQDVLEEGGRFVRVAAINGTVQSKLREPDLVNAVLVTQVDGLRDKFLQVIRRFAVPVDGEASDVAVGTAVHKLLHPVKTLAGVIAVGCGRADESSLAGIWGNVLFVGMDGIGRGHASLGWVVGFVEAEDVLAAAGKSSLDRRRPTAEHLAAPEHWHELNTVRDESHGKHVPVVRPGNSMSDRLNQCDIVVGSATLASRALSVAVVVAMGGGQSRGGQKTSSSEFGEANHFEIKKGVKEKPVLKKKKEGG